MTRFLLLIACFIGLPSCMSQAATSQLPKPAVNAADEKTERDEILGKVKTAIAANDFVGLSRMEEDFRMSRARTASGIWKLAVFHTGVQFYFAKGLRSDQGCQYNMAQTVRQWARATPKNPAPAITDAALLLQQAWCVRGSGYAQDVAPDAWPKFSEGVAAAIITLDKHKANAAVDPEFYAIELEALRAQGASRAVSDNQA